MHASFLFFLFSAAARHIRRMCAPGSLLRHAGARACPMDVSLSFSRHPGTRRVRGADVFPAAQDAHLKPINGVFTVDRMRKLC